MCIVFIPERLRGGQPTDIPGLRSPIMLPTPPFLSLSLRGRGPADAGGYHKVTLCYRARPGPLWTLRCRGNRNCPGVGGDYTMTPSVGTTEDFGLAFDAAGLYADEQTLPIFPTKYSGTMASSVMYQNLLTSTAIVRFTRPLICGIPNPRNDEGDLQPTEQYADVRPAQVIEFIESALETNNDWSLPSQHTDRSPMQELMKFRRRSRSIGDSKSHFYDRKRAAPPFPAPADRQPGQLQRLPRQRL